MGWNGIRERDKNRDDYICTHFDSRTGKHAVRKEGHENLGMQVEYFEDVICECYVDVDLRHKCATCIGSKFLRSCDFLLLRPTQLGTIWI